MQTPTQSSCDLADDSPNLRQAISLDNWHKMLLLLVYQIFVHTKIIANLLFPTSCVKCMESREKWEQDQALRPIISSYIEPCRTPLMKVLWLSENTCFFECIDFGFNSSLS